MDRAVRRGARRLELLDRVLAIAELLELRLDLGVVRDLTADVLDLGLDLVVALVDLRELVGLRLVDEEERDDLHEDRPEHDREPELAAALGRPFGVRASADLLLLRE